jgi:hypothetical protein
MANNGRYGEWLFESVMKNGGYTVVDVSDNEEYYPKDIDFLITSPTSGNTKSFEVKWDSRIHSTKNLYLETENVNSRQWNGEGWWLHCEADYLAYGDTFENNFYMISIPDLRDRVSCLPQRFGRCGNESKGLLISLEDIKDISIQLI